ncbi:MAG: hypothetical protein QXG10_02610 [Candidatus Hadarchaeales archaeon]
MAVFPIIIFIYSNTLDSLLYFVEIRHLWVASGTMSPMLWILSLVAVLLTLIVSSKAARINVPINHTIRLTLHLYLIPMIFSGILMILNLLSMYFFGIFSGECTLIIPVAGWTWFTAACALGMQTIGEISLKKAL